MPKTELWLHSHLPSLLLVLLKGIPFQLLNSKNLELLPDPWFPAKPCILELIPSGGQLMGAEVTASTSVVVFFWETFLKAQSGAHSAILFKDFAGS